MADEDDTTNPLADEVMRNYIRLKAAMSEVDALRGEFLTAMIFLEDLMDLTVIEYFKPDESAFFVEHLLYSVPLTAKIGLLRKLAKAHDLDAEWSPLFKRIDKLREERNQFAHRRFRILDDTYLNTDGAYRLNRERGPRFAKPDPSKAVSMQELQQSLTAAERIAADFVAFDTALLAAHASPLEKSRQGDSNS